MYTPQQRVLNDYRGPDFLAVVRLPPPPPVSNLSFFLSLPVCRWSSLLTGEDGGGGGGGGFVGGGGGVGGGAGGGGGGGGGGRGTKSYDREKAWPSIDHSILSGATVFHTVYSS